MSTAQISSSAMPYLQAQECLPKFSTLFFLLELRCCWSAILEHSPFKRVLRARWQPKLLPTVAQTLEIFTLLVIKVVVDPSLT
jgi:hypothetical protein